MVKNIFKLLLPLTVILPNIALAQNNPENSLSNTIERMQNAPFKRQQAVQNLLQEREANTTESQQTQQPTKTPEKKAVDMEKPTQEPITPVYEQPKADDNQQPETEKKATDSTVNTPDTKPTNGWEYGY